MARCSGRREEDDRLNCLRAWRRDSILLLWTGQTSTTNGVMLKHARKRKKGRYPELCGTGGRTSMVVIAGEVGGRWSRETQTLVQCLAPQGTVCDENPLQVTYYRRWSSLLFCSAAKALAISLLEQRGDPGAGGYVPSVHEVLGDVRHQARRVSGT